MADNVTPMIQKPRTHVDVRREVAAEVAKQSRMDELIVGVEAIMIPEGHLSHGPLESECTGECKELRELLKDLKEVPLVDRVEVLMIMSEKKGITSSLQFLSTEVAELRRSMTNGPANHILKATLKLKEWSEQSPNFITKAQQDELNKDRKPVIPNDEQVTSLLRQIVEAGVSPERIIASASKIVTEPIPVEPADQEDPEHGPFPVKDAEVELAQADQEKQESTTVDGSKVIDRRRFFGQLAKDAEVVPVKE